MARTARPRGATARSSATSLGIGVGVSAAMRMGPLQNQKPPSPVVILSTAHPAKFPQAVTEAIGSAPPEPKRLSGLKNLPERLEILANDPALIKRFIFSRLAS